MLSGHEEGNKLLHYITDEDNSGKGPDNDCAKEVPVPSRTAEYYNKTEEYDEGKMQQSAKPVDAGKLGPCQCVELRWEVGETADCERKNDANQWHINVHGL